ncbi:MAG TPA: adenylate/guanylate cyclase domain-containing protein [Solirubrobacterales bacterium]|nr:adenylate/guanylate cyclase domain-containing protein [Solirubrobacterales bacterium]
MQPETRYARSGELAIAYQVLGEGDLDLVVAFPFVSHLDLLWENPLMSRFARRLASFARVILFDRRGVGLSDPAGGAPNLEERMDDLRAVMDAAGSERAALLGMSEGATMCMLFAATYPRRTSALVLWGAMARSTAAPDYPWAPDREAVREAQRELVAPMWGQGATIDIFSPSMAEDPQAREFQARFERQAASPMRVNQLFEMFLDTDVRDALPLIQAPTLILHRRGDLAVNYRAGGWLSEHIEGSRYVELEGDDHMPWVGDSDAALAPIEEFLTGVRPVPEPQRVLATVLFTDIVDSTRLASELGDSRWRELLQQHQELVREQLASFEGREIKTTGDGFLATFDGPTRAAECARAVADAMPALGIEVRAGLHCGEVELMDDDVGGIAVHVAARIAARAAPRDVLASRTVRDLAVGSAIRFEPRGRHVLKGVADEWDLYSVASTPFSPIRRKLPMGKGGAAG